MDAAKTASRGAQSKLARELGLSRERVRQLAAKGMPLTSKAEAEEWIFANQPEGAGHRRENSGPRKYRKPIATLALTAVVSEDTPPPAANEAGGEQPEGEHADWLARAIAQEQEISTALRWAIKNKPILVQGYQRDYNLASRNRFDIEKYLLELRQMAGELIERTFGLTAIQETISAMLMHADGIPKIYSTKFGIPPEVAEPILQDAINELRRKSEAYIRQNKLAQ